MLRKRGVCCTASMYLAALGAAPLPGAAWHPAGRTLAELKVFRGMAVVKGLIGVSPAFLAHT